MRSMLLFSVTVFASAASATAQEVHEAVDACKQASVYQVKPCRAIEIDRTDATRPVVTYARRSAKAGAAKVRLSRGKNSSTVLMTVLSAAGAALAGPTTITDDCQRMLPIFVGDLNGDGKDDFVAMLQVQSRGGPPSCDVGFALSSGKDYRITAVRRNANPGARDFVDLGDGKCRFIHTEWVSAAATPVRAAKSGGKLVYRLLEFDAGRVEVSEDVSFPKVASRASPKAGAKAAARPVRTVAAASVPASDSVFRPVEPAAAEVAQAASE